MNNVTKKRTLLIISTLFAATLGGAVLAGCANRSGKTMEDVLNEGYTYAVTFDTAGGVWASGAQSNTSGGSTGEDGEEKKEIETTRMEVREMYLKPGSLLNQEKAESFASTVREGYTFNAFYTGTKDDNGNVTYGERWDFTKPVNESMTLYARWMENYSLVAHFGENFSKTKTFNVPQDRDGVAQSITSLSFVTDNVTVLGIYENEDKTGEFIVSNATPYTAPCDVNNKVHHIYVDTIDGTWTLVKDKKDFNIYSGSWLYLMIDIDFEGELIDFPTTFTGRIYGNNHTVSNFKVVQKVLERNDQDFGLFKRIDDTVNDAGEVLASAEIKDITFENVNFTATLNNPQVREYHAGIFAGRVSENAVIENVTVTGTFQFAITTKGRNDGDNHYEDTYVDWAIGYRLTDAEGNEAMDKYGVNIENATTYKYTAESLDKDEEDNLIFPDLQLPSTGGNEEGSDE